MTVCDGAWEGVWLCPEVVRVRVCGGVCDCMEKREMVHTLRAISGCVRPNM